MSSREIVYRGTHRLTGSPAHRTWEGMRARCNNPKDTCYKWYGARGIKICERWNSFENFLADMGERPPGMSLDRIDVNGNYEPGNCRWVTHKEQLRNTRRNRIVEYGGKEWCVTDLAHHLGLDVGTLRYRMRAGWPVERWPQRADIFMRPNNYSLG